MARQLHEVRVARIGPLVVHVTNDVEPQSVVEALDEPGETLKESSKWITKRVGEWVIKATRSQGGLTPLKLSLQRAHYRQAWRASLFLQSKDVGIALPRAFVERRRLGAIFANALVIDYLNDQVNVEEFALSIVNASHERIHTFLNSLARAVNKLCDTGAYHTDLSGKNIFTPDGESFYFIDLEGVVLGHQYTTENRLRTHIQLYDSFCDIWGPPILDPFIAAMLPSHIDLEPWLDKVKKGQRKRRSLQMETWRKQGKS